MATREDCIRAAVSSCLSEEDAAGIVDYIRQERQKLVDSGQVDDMGRILAKKVMDEAERARRKALTSRRIAAINIARREAIKGFAERVKSEGGDLVDALEALLVGSGKRFTGSRESASRMSGSLKSLWGGSLANDLEQAGLIDLIKRDRQFSDTVMEEMISPNSTGDKMARQAADIFSRYLENMRRQLNEYGADIGKLDNYAPQSHDSLKMRKAGEAAWVKYVYERLDWERTFPDADPQSAVHALGEVYQNIVTGVRGATAPKRNSVFDAPRNLATSLGKERVLHFKDAQSAVEYNRMFGTGNVIQAVLERIDRSARRLALMQTFGPNPESMIRSLLNEEMTGIRDAHGNIPDRLSKAWTGDKNGKLAHYYLALSGEMGTPENLTGARVAAFARAIMSMAKLGGAFLSSFSDIGIKTAAARHAGEGWLEAWKTGVEMRFERFQSAERVELARQLGVYTQGLLGELYSKFDVNDALSGKMTRWMNAFFRMSGLSGWTEAHRAAYTFHLSTRLARQAMGGIDALDPDLAAVLKKNGLYDRFELLGKMIDEVEGEHYVIPENAYRLTDDDLAAYLPDSLREKPDALTPEQWESARADGFNSIRQKLAQDVMGYFADETSYAVLEPDAKTRAAMYGNTKPGTWAGEMLRFAWQFKSFPVTYWQRILGESRWQRASRTPQGGFSGWLDSRRIMADVPAVVHFFLATTALGYVSMVAKDISKGRSPRNPWSLDTIGASFMQGGGLGLLGDFFLGTADRFGNQLTANMVGPVPTELSNLAVMTGQLAQGKFGEAGETAVRTITNNLPFVNLWYLRAGMDYMINYRLREWMSPGTLKRAERKLKEENNQTYFRFGDIDLTPSHVIPRGGF